MNTIIEVSEIFKSIQGETSFAGLTCIFIRLSGCNLDCSWCDTRYACDEPGKSMSLCEILSEVEKLDCPVVSVTGGEPLLQKGTPELCAELCKAGKTVLVETNGSLNIDLIAAPARRIVDMKPPASQQSDKMDFENLSRLREGDEVKFVLADRKDFDWAVDLIRRYKIDQKATVLMGAVTGKLEKSELAGWIIESLLNIRMQVQLHKVIWPGQDRGV